MNINKTHMIESSLSLLFDKPLIYVLYFSLRMTRVHKLYKFTSKESCCSGLPGEVISPHREKNKNKKIKTTIWYSDLKQFKNKQPDQ